MVVDTLNRRWALLDRLILKVVDKKELLKVPSLQLFYLLEYLLLDSNSIDCILNSYKLLNLV